MVGKNNEKKIVFYWPTPKNEETVTFESFPP